MDYQTFKSVVGELDYPTDQQKRTLIEGPDSVHLVIMFGEIEGELYQIDEIPDEHVKKLMDFVSLIESRGAIRGEDYFLGCRVVGHRFEVGVHTTHLFFSLEDSV